jgi:hypothetical protein
MLIRRFVSDELWLSLVHLHQLDGHAATDDRGHFVLGDFVIL